MAQKLTREEAVAKIEAASKLSDLLAVKKRDTAAYFANILETNIPGLKLTDAQVYGIEFIPKTVACEIIEAIKCCKAEAEHPSESQEVVDWVEAPAEEKW